MNTTQVTAGYRFGLQADCLRIAMAYRRARIMVLLIMLSAPAHAICTGDTSAGPPVALGAVEYLRNYYAFFHAPTRLATDANGNIYVTDPVNGRVFARDSAGRVILELTGLGSPVSIAVGNGSLYIGDRDAGRVRLFSLAGEPLGHLGQGEGEFTVPQDIAVSDDTGDVYVVDSEADRVRRYGPTGLWKADYGGSGSADGQFDFPVAIDVHAGEVFVVDQRNSRIQVLDRDGGFKFCIDAQVMSCTGFFCQCGGGFACSTKRQFDQGIHVDSTGRIFITDGFEGSVYVLERSGRIAGVIGTFNRLRMPTDITVDTFGRLFVASANSARLDVFGLGDFSDPEQFAAAALAITTNPVDQETALELVAYLELPGYRLAHIDTTSILANGSFSPVDIEPGDFDRDTIPDLRLVFSRDLVLALPAGMSTVTVTARLVDPSPPLALEARDSVQVLAHSFDSDGDGVEDDIDLCPATTPGDAVTADGCSLVQLCPCEGPVDGHPWKNHGQYVKCVSHTVKRFVKFGIIAKKDKGNSISAAANSACRYQDSSN